MAAGRWLRCAAVLLWAACAAPAFALELEYRGYIAGTRAGSATIQLERLGDRYAVRGAMATRGLWHRLSPWRARFVAAGRLRDGQAVPEALAVQETSRRKARTIYVAAGLLRQRRNGKLRPQRPAPGGLDLMSALWAAPSCDAAQTLNDGRHAYAMTLRERTVADDGAERCFYDIVDDEGERSRGWVELGMRHGARVPLQIVMIEGVERRLRLVHANLNAQAGERGFDWGLREAAATVTPALP